MVNPIEGKCVLNMFGLSSYSETLILRIWAWLFAFSGVIIYFFFGLSVYHLYAAFGSLVLAVVIHFLVSLSGGVLASLYLPGKNTPLSVDQKLTPELDKIRYHYRKGDYRQARVLIRQILEVVPDHGETLIWKAKIVLATDNDKNVATSVLKKVAHEKQHNEDIRVWAETLLKEIQEGRQE